MRISLRQLGISYLLATYCLAFGYATYDVVSSGGFGFPILSYVIPVALAPVAIPHLLLFGTANWLYGYRMQNYIGWFWLAFFGAWLLSFLGGSAYGKWLGRRRAANRSRNAP